MFNVDDLGFRVQDCVIPSHELKAPPRLGEALPHASILDPKPETLARLCPTPLGIKGSVCRAYVVNALSLGGFAPRPSVPSRLHGMRCRPGSVCWVGGVIGVHSAISFEILVFTVSFDTLGFFDTPLRSLNPKP